MEEEKFNYYLKNQKFYLKTYWKNNDGSDLYRPNGFKSYPENVYAAFCQQIDKNGKVLDLGCGNSLMLKHLMEHSGYQLIPYGIDFLELSIKQAKEIVLPQYAANFKAGNMLNYSFEKGPFDFIFLSPGHLYPQDRTLFFEKLKRFCQTEGKIIFYEYPDSAKALGCTWVGDFPELKGWGLNRKDYPDVSIGIWKNDVWKNKEEGGHMGVAV